MYSEIIPGFTKAVNEGLRDIRRVVKAAGVDHVFTEPTAIGWKVAQLDELHAIVATATDMSCELISISMVDKRYIAVIVMQSEVAGMKILKIMQRRPGSDDLLGLDHIDFFVDSPQEVARLIEDQSDLKVDYQSNRAHQWISVDCDGREAKLVDHSVLKVNAQEIQDITRDLQLEA